MNKAHDTAVQRRVARVAPAKRRVLPLVALFALVAMLAVNLTQQHASAQSPPCTETTFNADGTVNWCPQADASSYIVLWWEPDSTDADLGLQHTTVSGQASNSHAITDLTDGTTYETAVFTNDFAIVGSVAANSASGGTSSDPVVSITADGDVVEGAAAAFTVNATPPPTADLTVSVTVAATGDFGVTAGTQTITIATGATSAPLSIDTTSDSTPEADGSVTATLDAPAENAGYTVSSTHSAGTVTVSDNTPEVSITADGDVDEGAAAAFTISATPAPTADLTVSVTVAATGDFGVTAGAQTVTIPTTGSVALTVATTGDDVNEPDGSVTVTLDAPAADAGYTVSSTQGSGIVAVSDDDDTASGSIDPALIAEVQAHIDDFTARNHQGGINAWTKVLKRLNGESGGMSDAKIASWLADSRRHGWEDGKVTLPKVQAALTAQQQSQVQPTPEVSISAGSGVAEGAVATFTVTANPVPTADLSVSVTVSESGSYISGTAPTSVTIPTSGTATLTVPTDNDSADEADGSVTATLDDPAADAGYTVSSAQSAGTVAVADNDIPVVSISAGNNVTEGGDATFTVSASPTPAAALTVSVTVTQSGSYISGTAPTSVTIPTGGTATLTVPTDNDTTDETDGSVTATLVDGAAYDLGTNKVATVNVADDDDAPQSTDNSELIAEVQAHIDAFTARNHQGGINAWTAVRKRLNGQASGMTDAKIAKWLADSIRYNWPDGIQTLPKVQAALAAPQQQQQPVQPPTPEVNITASSGGTEGSNVTFTVTANPAPTSNLAVSVGIATSGNYGVTAGGRTVTIASGTTSKTLTLATTDDSVDEPNGSVKATLVNGSGYYTIGQFSSQTAQVTDDDDPHVQQQVVTPVVTISGGNGVTEGEGASFTLTATPAPDSAITVSVTVSASGDYGATTGSRTVSIGSGGVATLTVTTTNDGNDEANGSVTATLLDGTDYDLGANKAATVAVADDDDPPVITPVVSISGGADVTEGGHAIFTLTAAPAPDSTILVQVKTTSIGGYIPSTSTVSVQIGTTGVATYSVHTHDDSVDEADGSVTATLLDGTDYDLGTNKTATVAVSDDDDPPVVTPVVTISGGAAVTEGGSASFTLAANPAPTSEITVSVKIDTSGEYGISAGTQTVTISGGSSSATLTLATTDDSADEANGSVTVTLVDGTDYDLGANKVATVDVADDDVPVVSITGGDAVTEGGSASFTLTTTPTPASAITVDVTITTKGDYGVTTLTQTVSIPTGGSATFSVATTGDSTDEADGSVTATLVDGSDYDLGTSSATVAVADDDDAAVEASLTISIEDASASESASDLVFRVTLSQASNEDVTVWWATSNAYTLDRAKGGQGYTYDFWHATGEILIRAGETSGTGAVWLNQDSREEADEVFTVRLSSPDGATLERQEGTMTIIDDD